eukprot:c17598_g1_i2.p1 GENE.c17598_g1_i2~~c17598_g1_i2.p1  ORF type:complete len:529 (+),score=253.76 c17598_g1_i2:40-1626(+)
MTTTMKDIEDIGECGEACKTCKETDTCTKKPSILHEIPVLPPQHTYDVIIIGGGVVGCSIARALSKYKLRIALLDKDDDVAQGASKANSGIIHGGYNSRFGTLKARLGLAGNRMFEQLNKELNFGLRPVGSFVLATNQEEKKILFKELQNGIKNGVHDLRIVEREEMVKMEPAISRHVIAGLFCPSAAIVSPYEYTIALAENAVMNGVDLKLKHEVLDVQYLDDGRFRVSTRQQKFYGKFVINAAGMIADKVAAMVGANNFSIVPRKGEYLILSKSQGHLAKHILFPVPTEKGKGILVSQTYHGNLLLGPTARDASVIGGGTMTNRQVIDYIVSTARTMVEGIDLTETIASFSGLRARTENGDFIIEMSAVPGFVNVAGIDSPGLTSSPAIAQYTIQILKDAGLKLEVNTHFNPYRSPIIVPKGPTWKGSIDNEDPEKNIICRCERVTEAEIVSVLSHRPILVTSSDGVKKRTRAGMGPCQGKFCGERVARLIAREKHQPVESVTVKSPGSSLLPESKEEAVLLLSKL